MRMRMKKTIIKWEEKADQTVIVSSQSLIPNLTLDR